MYFIALVAPPEINQQVLKWKTWMKERFDCTVALKSPAHITLVPPFWMNPNLETALQTSLGQFSFLQNSFPIWLHDFFHFKPRVIFVNVNKNEQLNSLHGDLNRFLLKADNYPVEKDDCSFEPHVTIATRDLHKKAFHEAWEYFKDKKYEAEWPLRGISLLRHNKQKWDVISTSRFKIN